MNCKGISIFTIDEIKIQSVDAYFPEKIDPVKGTMKVHEVTWSNKENSKVIFRELSCLSCPPEDRCSHYHITDTYFMDTSFKRRLNIKDVYSSSDESNDLECPVAHKIVSPQKLDELKPNDYIVVKFLGKKNVKHYVGVVLSSSGEFNEEYSVKFMRKSGTKFIFSQQEDIADVEQNDIVCILDPPIINNRNQYTFYINENFENLC